VISKSAFVLVFIGLGLGSPASATAQTRSPMERFEVGAVGGLNAFTLAGTGDTNIHGRSTFHAGIVATVPLGPRAFLEPQVVYAGKGANARSSDVFGAINSAFRLTYIEVPVLVGLRFGTRVQPRVYVGPEIEFNINCELTATYIGQPYIPNTTTCADAGLVMKQIDAGMTGGGAVAFAYGRGTVSLEGRYTVGLTTISTIRNVRHRGLSLGVGYTMPLAGF